MKGLGRIAALCLSLVASAALAQAPPPKMPPELGAAYGRLGKAIVSHDEAGVKAVWAEDLVVNAPNNAILRRDAVIAALQSDLLDYRDFCKVIEYVGAHGDTTIVMGYDTMIPLKGPGQGQKIMRRFTDVWMKGDGDWKLVARQATIAAPME